MMTDHPLPSWRNGPARTAILDFVARVTAENGPDHVPQPERIAVFDNDGTLWCEQPYQVQVFFLTDRVRELAAKDPALAARQPFKAFLEGDHATLHALGKQGIQELFFATHAGMTAEARAEMGVTEGLLRINIGLEDVEDLREDLDQALRTAGF